MWCREGKKDPQDPLYSFGGDSIASSISQMGKLSPKDPMDAPVATFSLPPPLSADPIRENVRELALAAAFDFFFFLSF